METKITYVLNSDSPITLASSHVKSIPIVPRKGDMLLQHKVVYNVDYVIIDNDNHAIFVALSVSKFSHDYLRR